MANIFTALVLALNSIPVSGEENMSKMVGVIQTLKQMEAAANRKDGEVTEDG